jgi:hypothetical protein
MRPHDLPEVRVVLGRVARRTAHDADAARSEVVARLLLRRVQVPGRDELRTAALQGEKKCDGLRLEVDAGADRDPGERLRLVVLGADRPQQAAARSPTRYGSSRKD